MSADEHDLLEPEPDPDELEPPERPKRRGRGSERGKRSGAAARSGQRRPPQEARIREALEAIAQWISDRGDTELGGTLERDAPKMARVFGDIANVNPVAKQAVNVLADLLEPVRAFGPTLRIVWRRLLDRRERRIAELEQEPALEEELGPPVRVAAGPDAPQEPAVAEPWKIP